MAKRVKKKKVDRDQLAALRNLQLSKHEHVADDSNMTFSAIGPQLIDFMNVIDVPALLEKHVQIDKRNSTYNSDKMSQMLILQNILGIDRIENSRVLTQDAILKEKLGVDSYPDPGTFRNELRRYTPENNEQLFQVNQDLLSILALLTQPGYVDMHFDGKVITVYGDQEGAEVGYNAHKPGRKSYHLQVCTIEPFGFVLAICLQPGNSVSSTGFVDFYSKCVAAIPQDHFVIKNVRLDSGYFSEGSVEAFEGDYHFFEVVTKKNAGIKAFIATQLTDDDFEPFFPGGLISGASFTYRFASWSKPRDFVVVRKRLGLKRDEQGNLFPKYRYQVICHNQLDGDPKAVWVDYNKRAKIELNIRDLDYDHFITKVPTDNFNANSAYFWHCVTAHNLMVIFRNFLLPAQWSTARTSTLRKKLINIPGCLVNRSGKKVMRMMEAFPYKDILNGIKERIKWLYVTLHPSPA